MLKSTRPFAILAALAVSLAAAACGGGGEEAVKPDSAPIISTPQQPSTPSNPAPAEPANPSGPSTPTNPTNPSGPGTPGLQVSGSASLVGSQDVSVLFVGTALKPTGLAGNFLSALTVPATAQAVTAEGAYTTLGASNGAMTVKLSNVAEIDDVAGNGQYAIGRWKVGSFDVSTSTINNTQTLRTNQAAPYAVGIPLDLYSGPSTGTLACTYEASTKPTSLDGSIAAGTFNGAGSSATINLATKVITLNLSLDFGADQAVTVAKTNVLVDMPTTGGGSSVIAETVGSDVSKPYLVVAYGTVTPTSGEAGGLVVFRCQ